MSNCKHIDLGYSGENKATTVSFPISPIIDKYGTGGTWLLLNRRPGEFSAYPVPELQLTIDNGNLVWLVSSYDVEKEGQGSCQIVYTIADVVKLSVKYETHVTASLVGEYIAPDPYESWLEQLAEIAERAEHAAAAAEDSEREAQDHADQAETSAEEANAAADAANISATEAAEHAGRAQTFAEQAETAEQNARDHANNAENSSASASAAADRAEAAAAEGAFVIKRTTGTNIDKSYSEIVAAFNESRPLILVHDKIVYTLDAYESGQLYFASIQYNRTVSGKNYFATRRLIINANGQLTSATATYKIIMPTAPASGEYTLTAKNGTMSWEPAENYTLLWQNPDPTATFNQVNVTLSESMENYKLLIIEAGLVISGQEYQQATAITSPNFFVCFGLEMVARGKINMQFFIRDFAKVNATTIQFHTCRMNVVNKSTGAWSAEVVDQQGLIPFRIYGAK